MATTETARCAGRISCSRSRSTIRCSSGSAGSRCWTSSQRKAAHAVRTALARAGRARLQEPILRRSSRARRRVPSGNRLGMADRTVGRRVAQTAPQRPCRRSRVFSTAASRRSTTSASARSPRSSTPKLRSRPEAASRKPGAWRRCCGVGQRRRPWRPRLSRRSNHAVDDDPYGCRGDPSRCPSYHLSDLSCRTADHACRASLPSRRRP